MKLLLSMFAYPFIVRAFVVGILVSLCASLLGVPLVLKRYSMIGDGLSHVSFGALSVAVACGFAPLWFSIPVVVIAAFILMHVAEKSRVSADAMIAVFSASALAIGVIVTSLTTGMTTDVDSYMFGSILAMSRSDVILSVTLALCVLALYILFYHKLFSVTFDESFARATGVRVGTYKTILSVLTALTVVLGMRMMGAMLLSSLIIFPALTAMRVFGTFRSVTICAAVVSVVNFLLGMVLSYALCRVLCRGALGHVLLPRAHGVVSALHPRGCDGRRLRPCGVPPLLPDRPRTGMTHFLNFLKGCACKLAKHSLSCYVDGSSLFHTSLKKSAKL